MDQFCSVVSSMVRRVIMGPIFGEAREGQGTLIQLSLLSRAKGSSFVGKVREKRRQATWTECDLCGPR